MHERPSTMNKDSRSGSLTSDVSVKAVLGATTDDDQLITALVKRILSKALIPFEYETYCSCHLGVILLRIDQNKMMY